MSTTSSPRSDWFSSSRIRRPSKASPVASSSSEVHVDAQPAYGASPEGRAQSRQTLSRHLSQSKLGVESDIDRLSPGDLGRPRSGSVNSTASATSSANPARGTFRRSTTPLNTPTGSPAVPRRRSSATAGPTSIPRSPSWYQTTSRKSSLASPALSTIEGSIADLRVDNSYDEDVSSVEPPSAHNESPTGSTSMKRDRTSHSLSNPKQPKRQATEEDRKSEPVHDTEPVAISSLVDVTQGPSVSDRDSTSTAHADALSDEGSKASTATLRTWRSYLILPRSSKLSRATPGADGPISGSSENLGLEDLATDSAKSCEQAQAIETNSGVQNPAFSASPNPQIPKARSSDLVHNPKPQQESGQNAKQDTIAFATSDTAEALGRTSASQDSKATQENVSSEPASNATLRPAKGGHTRPTSWWGWPVANSSGVDELHSSMPQPNAEAQENISSEPAPLKEPVIVEGASAAVAAQSSPGEEISLANKSEGRASASTEETVRTNNTTWSAWLGSYLSTPVETTAVTYAAGIAPSITSSVASSMVPDADETSPPPPNDVADPVEHVHMTPSPTLQRINPLLDVMPRSTWSSFFASRILPYQKTIDNKPAHEDTGEAETMEIDFGSLAPSEIAGESVNIESSGSQASSSTMKQGIGADGSFQPHSRPSGSDMPALQVSSDPASKISTIKPLTKDKRAKSSTASVTSKSKPTTAKTQRPNLVLPTFEDTFERPPRSLPLPRPPTTSPAGLKKAVTASLTYLFSNTPRPSAANPSEQSASLKGKEREVIGDLHERLPKSHKIAGTTSNLHQNGKIAVIGIHGWFIQTYLKNVVGEPTGTSTKFANMMKASVKAYYAEMGCPLNDEAVTAIPLEGDGTVKDRTERLYENLMARQDWVEALNNADRIFIASHSQGTIVSTMLVERLINEGEINGTRCMMLNMCSVSQGPFYSLYNSWTVPAYLYFETAAATELFEFQKPQSAVSKAYIGSLQHILNAGVKILFVASLNDQVVPLYSALFSSLSHPNILRTIFIDSSVFETSADFMTNLVVFSTRLRNAGLNCHGLDFHLSEALMGSLVGVGHSTVYEEAMVYKYAVRYLMETTSPLLHGPNAAAQPDDMFKMEDFNPRAPANPYYLPWALRGIIEDAQIRALFSEELQTLRDQFEVWQPKTKALQQVQAALEPLRLIPRSAKSESEFETAVSKTDKKATAKL